MATNNWICIYSTDQEYKAALIQGVLEEEEIPVNSINQRDSIYQFGEIHLYVPAEYTLRAIELVRNADEL